MEKNKLQRHLETNYPNCIKKLVEFFERKLKSIQGQRSIMSSYTAENKLAVYSLYAAFYQIAKQKKARTIGEDLLMPVMKEVVKIMIGEKESKNLDAVSLSKNTVKRRIADMSNYVLQQIVHTSSKKIFSSFDSIGRVHRYGRPSTPFCVHSLHQQYNYIRGFLILQSVEIAYKG